ncbi:hypothetical protein [Marinomonas ostreistagni]|uniref:DUF2442 domain-containing protein n=1 Tax=Marinomonas ostreistagni TaxID=359209 RepID=A0ABS0ZE11_9GAMM|nr:hypothetical protein [Marinomonas ostreistagni]MBJ7551911.1 hypothetical protein [Marinomonas ostreistagni]
MSAIKHSAYRHKINLKFTGLNSLTIPLVELYFTDITPVELIKLNDSSGIIVFHYDASLITFEEVIDSLSALNVLPCKSLWWRWRYRAAQEISDNIRANARHKPHCCAKAPNVHHR